ncbi:MAG TPA: lytic transglycosylase domain-containing protein [Candidatus Baltobacteraceae bacterium]|jgi:soluble lytic murein transglycosylase-like protein
MDITTEIASVQARIAQITGMSAAGPSAVAGPGAAGAGVDGLPLLDAARPSSFAGMVQSALGASAPNAPSMVPPAQIDSLVQANSAAWGVDPALVKAIIANESGFNANATSRTGAQGLMQLEPGTAAGLGVSDSYDPAQNVWGGTRYIRGLLERFHGDMRLAVAAYNAGPGAVEKYDGVPPYAETQNYVQNVLSSYDKYKGEVR